MNLKHLTSLSLVSLIVLVGCGQGGLPSVSGLVTVKGEPKANVRVVFAPMATEDTINPGPPSLGVTDSEGRYVLKTKSGADGAVAGQHKVTFKYDDLEHVEDLKSWLSSAETKEDAAAAKQRLDYVLAEIASRGKISKSASQTVVVPSEGKSDADFEIGEE